MNINSIATMLSSQGSATSSAAATDASLSRDAFLRILVAQLQNQDPTAPMEDKDFIAQMAQFSSLEQMQQLNSGFGYTQAYSLLGKTVTASMVDETGQQTTISGVVTGVTTVSGAPYLIVGDKLVPLSASMVVEPDAGSATVLQSALLIGKTVTASYLDENGEKQTITGVVTSVSLENGQPMATVDGKLVHINDITAVTETAAG